MSDLEVGPWGFYISGGTKGAKVAGPVSNRTLEILHSSAFQAEEGRSRLKM